MCICSVCGNAVFGRYYAVFQARTPFLKQFYCGQCSGFKARFSRFQCSNPFCVYERYIDSNSIACQCSVRNTMCTLYDTLGDAAVIVIPVCGMPMAVAPPGVSTMKYFYALIIRAHTVVLHCIINHNCYQLPANPRRRSTSCEITILRVIFTPGLDI